MGEGDSREFDIVPARDARLVFQLRVRNSASKNSPHRLSRTGTAVGVAGYTCDAYRWPMGADQISLSLMVRHKLPASHPALAGVSVAAHMVLLDRAGSPAPSVGKASAMDASDSISGGCSLRATRDDVEKFCVVDDYFVLLCSVDIVTTMGGNKPSSAPAPLNEEELTDLGHGLATMLDNLDLTDVRFDVDGESFSAHRLVLAARSPVFRAELYGPMAESKMTSITIHDVKASTFRYMLHYMYHGSLPNSDEKGKDPLSAVDHQHLLVAADRYGVERLKGLCERKLCDDFTTVDTVVSMLALAEERACSKLKARCFDFLAKGENFKMVGTTPEYLHLMQSIPSLMLQVRNRFNFNIAHPDVIMNPPS
ncbi:BTB/POZ and MATH domain-containing protein 1-like [Lolium rigidum]|uniref:BTB/POZ and MATH domain-containing protein 1-like n=1 Tax=Lolium rigidum TaxID=89674 RepID=UPI001F5E31B3|nr:BTB/POZ and MATH domain-containing protein 1-like [Lolium rigidum]